MYESAQHDASAYPGQFQYSDDEQGFDPLYSAETYQQSIKPYQPGGRKLSMKASKNRRVLDFNAPPEESDETFDRYLQPALPDPED